MSIRKLEDLTVWNRAKQVNNQAYQVIKTIKDFDYQRQMKRSALSIPSNIAEGFGRREGGKKGWICYGFMLTCGQRYLLPCQIDVVDCYI